VGLSSCAESVVQVESSRPFNFHPPAKTGKVISLEKYSLFLGMIAVFEDNLIEKSI